MPFVKPELEGKDPVTARNVECKLCENLCVTIIHRGGLEPKPSPDNLEAASISDQINGPEVVMNNGL